jgi:hypothetical protein
VYWQEQLAGSVARAYFCKLFVIPGSNAVVFCGHQSDRDIAVYVYTVLVRTIISKAREACREHGRNDKAFKDSYYTGFVAGIQRRLRERREQIDNSMALVRVTAEVSDYYTAQNRKASKEIKRRGLDSLAAIDAGMADAQNVSLDANALKEGAAQPKALKRA